MVLPNLFTLSFGVDDAGRKRMLNKHIRGNRQLPICIRGLMKKFFEPEADMLELIKVRALSISEFG